MVFAPWKYAFGNLIVLAFLSLQLNHSLYGQAKSVGLPAIRNYTKADSQSGTQNWNIDQDSNGNVYFANNNGLLQFDGSTWRTYTIPTSSNIRSVKIDDESGRIYVGAYNDFGYFESNGKGDLRYVSLISMVLDENFKTTEFIWKIHIIGDEVIFQSFKAAYIFKDNDIKIIPAPERFQFSFKVGNKLYFQEITKGILEYREETLITLKGSEIFNDFEIWGIFPLGDTKLVIATLEAGLFTYQGGSINSWDTEANDFIKENGSLGGTLIDDDMFILNSVLGGIIICNGQGNIIQHIDIKKGLINNTVLSSFVDREKNLWLGLDNGISYLNINSPFTYFSSSLYFSSVYASVVHKGNLYVATNQGVFYHKLNGSIKDDSFNLVGGTTAQSWNIQIISDELVCANNKGALVIKDGKLDRILDSKGYYGFREIPGHPNHFIGSNYEAFAVFEKTPEGLVFKNTIHGFYNTSKDFEVEDQFVWLLKDHFLYQLEFDKGLKEFSLKKRIEGLDEKAEEINTLQKINGKLYFVTNNRFYTYSKFSDSFQEETYLSGMFEDIPEINAIKQDTYGNLWYYYNQSQSLGALMKTEQGNYVDNQAVFSNLADNFVSNYLSINTLDPHNIFIGQINGLSHYDSNFSSGNPVKPIAFIRSFSFGMETNVQGNPQNKIKDYILLYADNNVRFTFSSPDFENSGNVFYSYQLENFDKGWSNWTKETIKEYTNLKEGSYTMNLKTKNIFGVESDSTTLTFAINPPWYRHSIAYWGYFLIICLLIYLIRLQIKAKIRKNKYYETIEQRKIYLEKESKIRMEQFKLEKRIQKLNRDRLKTKILAKDKELVNNSLQVVKKNKILNNIVQKLKEVDTESMNEGTKSQLNKLKKTIAKEINNNSWKDLEKHIKNVHFEFIKRLKEKYPTISPRELDLSTYLLMNMSTKEIAEVMNISSGGVELARYRLRKKLGLARKENLTGFLMNV